MIVRQVWARSAALLLVMALVACGLPRTGPNKSEIFNGSVQKTGNAYIIPINDRVVRATKRPVPGGFSSSFKGASRLSGDSISPGDVLSLSIYENVETPLLGGGGINGGPSNLAQLQVDQTGHIYIPFAGRVLAAGNTPDQLRLLITRKLESQTPDPQVVVARLAGEGASVTIMGTSVQGVYPITPSTNSLSSMIAKAGGASSSPEATMITVIRGNKRNVVWMSQLFEDPRQDIALRPNDRILVELDRRRYTALGATGGQSLVPFSRPEHNALEALAQIGGLNSSLADPTGIFVFRDEKPRQASKVLGQPGISTEKRIAYVLDLKATNGIFLARDFQIQDGDTIYVTEAPYVQWVKTLQAITGAATSVESLSNVGN